jgi:hypothetical protein
MTCQYNYKPNCVRGEAVGIFDADDPEDKVDCLKTSRANDYAAVCLFVDYSLVKVCESSESKKNSEENCCRGRWTKTPVRLRWMLQG